MCLVLTIQIPTKRGGVRRKFKWMGKDSMRSHTFSGFKRFLTRQHPSGPASQVRARVREWLDRQCAARAFCYLQGGGFLAILVSLKTSCYRGKDQHNHPLTINFGFFTLGFQTPTWRRNWRWCQSPGWSSRCTPNFSMNPGSNGRKHVMH